MEEENGERALELWRIRETAADKMKMEIFNDMIP